MENKRFQYSKKYVIDIEWQYDEWPDLSWLGKPTDTRGEYMIDRREGVFLGELVRIGDDVEISLKDLKPFLVQKAGWKQMHTRNNLDWEWVEVKDIWSGPFVDEDDALTSDAWEAADRQFRQMLSDRKLYVDESRDCPLSFDYDEDRDVFYLNDEYAYRLLKNDLGSTYGGHNEFRYFDVEGNHLPHNPRNWEHVEDKVKADLIAHNGSLEQVDIGYAIDDWKRWEDYGTWWWMMGCVVTVEDQDGNELGYAALWGIEDDSEEQYLEDTEVELLAEALSSAGLTKVNARKVWQNFEAGRYEVA